MLYQQKGSDIDLYKDSALELGLLMLSPFSFTTALLPLLANLIQYTKQVHFCV